MQAVALWSQNITDIIDVNISAPSSILWAFTAAVFASTAFRAVWREIDTVTYEILPSTIEMSSSLVPVLLGVWQLWMLVSTAMLLVIDDTTVLLPICCQDQQQYASRNALKLHLLLHHSHTAP